MNFSDVAVAKRVVETFVVGELKTKRLARSLAIPIHFRKPDEFRNGGDCFAPKFKRRRLVSREERSPGARKNVIEYKHGHVATNAVAMLGDFAQFVDESGARDRLEIIQLDDVAPRREVRIASVGQ